MAVGIQIGDYVYVDYHHKNGTVMSDRGGHVGRWFIKYDDGDTGQVSSRDITIVRPVRTTPTPQARLTADEKIDMLLEYLGLEVKDEPEIVKKEKEESND